MNTWELVSKSLDQSVPTPTLLHTHSQPESSSLSFTLDSRVFELLSHPYRERHMANTVAVITSDKMALRS
jgi:hypothetical protein